MCNKIKKGDSIHPVCPFCGASLLDFSKETDQEPSIKLVCTPPASKENERHNRHIFLSRIWGSFHQSTDSTGKNIPQELIRDGEKVEMSCPYCYRSLTLKTKKCDFCNSPMFMLLQTDEHKIIGSIKVCSQKGCHSHESGEIPNGHKFDEELQLSIKHRKKLMKFNNQDIKGEENDQKKKGCE